MTNDPEEAPREKTTSAQWTLVMLIVAIASASFLYRALVVHRLEQTAALFIGIPSGDGTPAEEGVRAFGRVLEHLNFGWAMAGFALRLPVVWHGAQLLMDVSGLGPRRIVTHTQETD